jgi:ABC-type uncharacterized transport system substrate-binding protein
MERSPEAALAEAETNAVQARALMQHPAMQRAFSLVEQKLTDGWKNTSPLAKDERELAWQMLQALEAVKKEIAVAIVAPEIVRRNTRSARTAKRN